MLKIRLSSVFPEWHSLHQTPGSKGIWRNYQFFTAAGKQECDFWVIYGGLAKPETSTCSPENTILVTGEPPTVQRYNRKFLEQFGTIITCHRNIDHPRVIHTQQALNWHVGRRMAGPRVVRCGTPYDELKSIKSWKKEKLISVICSAKSFTPGHRKRLDFVRRLYEFFGPHIGIFGYGIRGIEDKWDAISKYKYHIAIENSSFEDYWTEKLSDAFLGGAYPLYYGCPNLSDYFPADSFTRIDINDFEKSIKIIKSAFEEQLFENSTKAILKARDLVLDRHNFFPMIVDVCNNRKLSRGKDQVTLLPEESLALV